MTAGLGQCVDDGVSTKKSFIPRSQDGCRGSQVKRQFLGVSNLLDWCSGCLSAILGGLLVIFDEPAGIGKGKFSLARSLGLAKGRTTEYCLGLLLNIRWNDGPF